VDVIGCAVERWTRTRNASHFIRGAIKNDSPQTVLSNVTQLFAHGKSLKVFDATDVKRVAQNFRLTKRGLMRFWIADLILEY
jgi:hypothetical protein